LTESIRSLTNFKYAVADWLKLIQYNQVHMAYGMA